MDRITSFSQNMMFEKCSRCWYMKYIEKIPVVQDMCYADAGTVIHKTIESYYNIQDVSMDDLKKFFSDLWNNKKLPDTKLKLTKDEYWLMVLNAIDTNEVVTTNELKIFFPDVVGYLDCANTKQDKIIDWKSSRRRPENEEEYKKQLLFYSFLYYRKFMRLPKEAIVYYLRYSGNKGKLIINPTAEDVITISDWHNDIRNRMEEVIKNATRPDKCKDCFMFCPYVDHCNSTKLKFSLYLMGNYIFINGPIDRLLNRGLQKKFSYELKNAYFIKKANPYAKTNIYFWDFIKRKLPIGFLSGLKKTLNDYAKHKDLELEINTIEQRSFNYKEIDMPDKFINKVTLRDYQIEAVNKFLDEKICMLEVATGGGKTEISIEIIRKLRAKTLFIVDKIELLRQTKKRIEDSLGIEVGMIGAGEDDIKHITVGTVQTLAKNINKYSEYLQSIRFVIFDECHHVSAQSYWKLAHHLVNTEYRLGMSGTAYRDDGNDMMINATTGYKAFDLGSKILIDKGWLVLPSITFVKNYMDKNTIRRLENNAKSGLINETPNYINFYNSFIAENDIRNDLIVRYTNKFTVRGKKVLILTKLIDHGKLLQRLIPESEHLYGVTNKEDRKKMFKAFTEGKLNVLISTISIFAEGIDMPSLDVVINAAANKGEVKSIQVLGRILRKMEGKKDAYYYDFIDETHFFRLASLARKKAFWKEGHYVEVKDEKEIK